MVSNARQTSVLMTALSRVNALFIEIVLHFSKDVAFAFSNKNNGEVRNRRWKWLGHVSEYMQREGMVMLLSNGTRSIEGDVEAKRLSAKKNRKQDGRVGTIWDEETARAGQT